MASAQLTYRESLRKIEAWFACYGIVGVILLLYIFYKINITAWKILRGRGGQQGKELSVAVIILSTITPLLLFFYRVLEFRIFSYYFWLIIALMFVSSRIKTQNNSTLNTEQI